MKICIDGTNEDGLSLRWEDNQLPIKDEWSVIVSLFSALSATDISDISEVMVNAGPGYRFTRTRQSVVVANALAYALGIKVNGTSFVVPLYYMEPHITTSSKNIST